MPATQPTLGLPTMNKACETIRAANREANKRGFTLPPAELEKALRMAETAHGWLQEAYRVLQPHVSLSVQCETAGKATRHLRDGIKARIKGDAP